MKRIAMLLLAAILFAGGDVRAQGLSLEEMSAEQVQDELASMNWQYGPGSFALPNSGSTIELTQDQEILIGEEAARYDYLTGGIESPETEAIVWSATDDSQIFITFFDVGYVTEEDWEKVNPADFMKQMMEIQESANAEREQVGYSPFYIAGWRQEPTFDPMQHTAFWATDLSDPEGTWVNAVALRLSRDGYHHIIWSGGTDSFVSAETTLGGLLASHQYDSGHRYDEYVDGDPHSDTSIGQLAAAAMGVDIGAIGAAGVIGAAILFLKKGWVIVIPVVAGIVAWMRRRKRKAVTATGTPPDSTPPPAIT